MIYIAYNHDGIITSIVSAKSKELALAYWQGTKDGLPHESKCLETDFTPLSEHPTGVMPVLITKTINIGNQMNPNNIVTIRK